MTGAISGASNRLHTTLSPRGEWRHGDCCDFVPLDRSATATSSIGIDSLDTQYKALYLTLDKAYTAASGWGLNIAYTLQKAEKNGNDLFSLDKPTPDDYGFRDKPGVERHRLVISGLLDLPLGYKIVDAHQAWQWRGLHGDRSPTRRPISTRHASRHFGTSRRRIAWAFRPVRSRCYLRKGIPPVRARIMPRSRSTCSTCSTTRTTAVQRLRSAAVDPDCQLRRAQLAADAAARLPVRRRLSLLTSSCPRRRRRSARALLRGGRSGQLCIHGREFGGLSAAALGVAAMRAARRSAQLDAGRRRSVSAISSGGPSTGSGTPPTRPTGWCPTAGRPKASARSPRSASRSPPIRSAPSAAGSAARAARDRTLTTLRFFATAPQGPAASGVTGHQGFFYHFIDMETGHRFETTELSSIDTALLLGGMLFAAAIFRPRRSRRGRDPPPRRRDQRPRRLAVDARQAARSSSMGWRPGEGLHHQPVGSLQ